jgi:hypothetical protein
MSSWAGSEYSLPVSDHFVIWKCVKRLITVRGDDQAGLTGEMDCNISHF